MNNTTQETLACQTAEWLGDNYFEEVWDNGEPRGEYFVEVRDHLEDNDWTTVTAEVYLSDMNVAKRLLRYAVDKCGGLDQHDRSQGAERLRNATYDFPSDAMHNDTATALLLLAETLGFKGTGR